MESAGLRRRAAIQTQDSQDSDEHMEPDSQKEPDNLNYLTAGHEPPRFTIDLSVPPSHRYDHIIPSLSSAIASANIADQFNEVLDFLLPDMRLAQRCLYALVSVLLRRLYSDEETAELRGISRATGLPMHLLVAFNVSLDILLGCTSGGVRYQPFPGARARIAHFRTLDWTMDPLRNLVVELDYVTFPGGPVIATTVGYLGYVGVLTGVRPGLSMSLNYRPHHDTSTLSKRLSFRWNQLLVILGFRPSISSTLRSFLLPPLPSPSPSLTPFPNPSTPLSIPPALPSLPTISSILAHLQHSPSTAAYLLFTTPSEIYALQKDNRTTHLSTSSTFLTICNHDLADEEDLSALERMMNGVEPETVKEWLVRDSIVRKEVVKDGWEGLRREERGKKGRGGRMGSRRGRKNGRRGEGAEGGGEVVDGEVVEGDKEGAGGRKEGSNGKEVDGDKVEWVIMGMEEVLGLVRKEEVSNEMTHYTVVMDTEEGKVMWRRVYDVGELGVEEQSEDDEELGEGGVEDGGAQQEPQRSLREKAVGFLGW